MEKKVAIITLHDVKNYGSALQAYATQCYFQNLGLETEIIDFRRPWETPMGYWFYCTEKSLKGVLRNILYFPSKLIQNGRFKRFKKKNLLISKEMYVTKEDFKKNPIEADVYCTGSDQVWNSGWNNGVISEYLLDFPTRKNAKKISFAASFGDSNILDSDVEIMAPFLKEYDLLTVREKPSVEMLKSLFDLESKEILDPTLQMNGNFWRGICKPERKVEKKYILLIQLNRNHQFDELAVKFSKEKGFLLLRLCLRVDQIVLPGKSVIIPEVEDYVRLIRDAECVLTDSFHAVSFCLNLEKQFYVYYPEKYSERLKSILSIMGLENRLLERTSDRDYIDYDRVNDLLEKKRLEARECIRTIL